MSDSDLDERYPGVGRLNYFLGKIGLIAAMMFSAVYFGPGSSFTRVLAIIISIASFVLDVMRLRNIGISQWFAFLRFFPYLNLLYLIALLSVQSGWAETRRLDRDGKTIAGFLLVLALLAILTLLRLRIAIPLSI